MQNPKSEYWLKTIHKYIGFLSFLPLIGLISMVTVVSLKMGELPTRSTNSIQWFTNSAYGLEEGSLIEGLFLDLCNEVFINGTIFLPLVIVISLITSINLLVTKRQNLISTEGFWFPIISLALILALMTTDFLYADLSGWYFE